MKNYENWGLGIQSPALLKKVLTHRSWAHENNCKENNERLEFLGDAVLSLVIGNYIFLRFQEAPEGELARLRGGIVNTDSLAKTSKQLKLGDYLLLGKGEEASGGRAKDSLLADTYEAVIGGIYLESGLEAAESFILRTHKDVMESVFSCNDSLLDAKSKLQEAIQKTSNNLPEYLLIKETGPDHDKTFLIEVFFAGISLGVGEGPSKKIAQQNAAKKALINWEKIKEETFN